MLRIVSLNKIQDNRARFPAKIHHEQLERSVMQGRKAVPDGKVIILVIDEGRDTAIGVVLHVLGAFEIIKIKVPGLIGEAEGVQHEGDFPEWIGCQSMFSFDGVN